MARLGRLRKEEDEMSISYDVQVCFVIDCSGSMSSLLPAVQAHALSFEGELRHALAAQQKAVDSIEVRVVGFRGAYDHPLPTFEMMDRFVRLPDEAARFKVFVERIESGDDEAGLEALALAIASPWNRTQGKKRHIVVLYTDEPPHDLGRRDVPAPIPLPASLDALQANWESGMDRSAKRLVMFTDGSDVWRRVATEWTNTVHLPVASGGSWSDVLGSLVASI
jgi:hypothetical protein